MGPTLRAIGEQESELSPPVAARCLAHVQRSHRASPEPPRVGDQEAVFPCDVLAAQLGTTLDLPLSTLPTFLLPHPWLPGLVLPTQDSVSKWARGLVSKWLCLGLHLLENPSLSLSFSSLVCKIKLMASIARDCWQN